MFTSSSVQNVCVCVCVCVLLLRCITAAFRIRCITPVISVKLSDESLLGHPTLYVGGLIFYQAFFFLSFFRQLISELAERNSTIFGHMVESKCSLKIHVRNLGYPISVQTGGPNHLCWTTSQINGNFNSLYLRNETRYR